MRNQNRPKPAPLPHKEVATFFDVLRAGDVSLAHDQLSCTPRLSNARMSGITPLMASMSADLYWETQIKLIDLLMRNNASLAARDDNRMHVMLHACEQGASPKVIKHLMYWNDRRGGDVFRWSHCDSCKNGALVLAASSGSIPLVQQLLVIRGCCNDDSNDPVKVLKGAIDSGNEQLVLLILDHYKSESMGVQDVEMYISDDDCYNVSDDDDDYYNRQSCWVTLKVSDCVDCAFESGMFEAVQSLASLSDDVHHAIWLCCQKGAKAGSPINGPPASLVAIGKRFFVNMTLKENPTLLPLLIGRLRILKSHDAPDGAQCLLSLEADIFKRVISLAFCLDPVDLERNLKHRQYFEANCEYCEYCDGFFLPFHCGCKGYYSTWSD